MTAEQLRNSILQEAISGRLVPQDPNDEPERSHEFEYIDAPFDIPSNWKWCLLGDLIDMISGTSYKKGDVRTDGIRILRGGNIVNDELVLADDDVFLSDEYASAEKNIRKDDIIIVASTGSQKVIGKPALIKQDYSKTQIGAFLRIIRAKEVKYVPYIWMIFKGAYYREHIRSLVKGTNINNIKEEYITKLPIPLPPLAEQQRIVAKLEELFPIVEQYGKAQTELDELNAALPSRLRQSILQQAFTGELTHSDVSEWTEEKLGSIADILYGFPFQANMFNEEKKGKPIIRIRNIVPSWTHTYSTETCDEKYLISKGDMLVGMDGNFNVRFWKGEDAYLNQRVCRITAHAGILHQKYLYYYLPVYLQELEENVSRTTVGHLSDKHLKNMPIPLPPLAVQQRIVAKIEELFAEIDKLK